MAESTSHLNGLLLACLLLTLMACDTLEVVPAEQGVTLESLAIPAIPFDCTAV